MPAPQSIELPPQVDELISSMPIVKRRPFRRKSYEAKAGKPQAGRPQTCLTDPTAPPTEKYMLIARHHMAGLPNTKIAQKLSLSAGHVGQILASPVVQAYIKSFHAGVNDKAEKQQCRIIELGDKAIDALEGAIDHGDIKDQVAAANSLLDRNPATSKHSKRKDQDQGATPADIARWKTDTLDQAEVVDAEFEELEELEEPLEAAETEESPEADETEETLEAQKFGTSKTPEIANAEIA